jgi:hypothetical protein
MTRMSNDVGEPPLGGFATLIPEFAVSDLTTSLQFWCDVRGFRSRTSGRRTIFVFLERGPLPKRIWGAHS